MTESSPYRCGTCNPKCSEYQVVRDQERTWNQGHLRQMERFTALKGCLAHNDLTKNTERVLDELDKRCEIAAREDIADEEKGIFASDTHRDPFNEVREWIKELRQQAEREQREDISRIEFIQGVNHP